MDSGGGYAGHSWQNYISQHQPYDNEAEAASASQFAAAAAASAYQEPTAAVGAVAGISGLYHYNNDIDIYAAMSHQNNQQYGQEQHTHARGNNAPHQVEHEQFQNASDDEEEDTAKNNYGHEDDNEDDVEQEPQYANDPNLKPSNKQHQQYLQLWETRYAQLAEYHKQHKTCIVPLTPETKVLHTWVGKQKKQYRAGKLSQERQRRLCLVGFDAIFAKLDSKPRPMLGLSREGYFEKRCADLIEFKEKYGHCNVPGAKAFRNKHKPDYTEDHLALGDWLNHQNYEHVKGKYPAEKRERLESIGFVFRKEGETQEVILDRVWKAQYKALIQYKNKHGHAKVPSTFPENQPLAQWVANQRDNHTRKKLSKERVKKLEAIGFDFRLHADGAWDKKYQELIEYVKRWNECRVPLRFECSASLREWTIKQKKKNLENKLSKERASRLKKLGFDFIPIKEHHYEDSFRELEKFKAEHGHTNVPPSYKDNPQLAKWVEIQREKYARDKISIKHHTLLEGIGFNWEVSTPAEENIAPAVDEADQNHGEDVEGETEEVKKMPILKKSLYDEDIMDHPCIQERNAEYERTWNEHYAQLIEFQREHGHCTVGRSYNLTLCNFVRKQRENYRHSNLTKDRYEKLAAINFEFQAQKRDTSAMIAKAKANAEKKFEARCKLLAAFVQENGHCNVPTYSNEEKKKLPREIDAGLGNWVMLQNKYYRKGELSQTRFDRLTECGWKPFTNQSCSREDARQWDKMYQVLVAYKGEHGNSDVQTTHPPNQELANWCISQRTRYAQKKMDQSRIDRLTELDFQFKPFVRESKRKAEWEERYRQLEQFKAKYGKITVPLDCKDPDFEGLGNWVQSQRYRHRAKKIIPEEEAMLVLLGLKFHITMRPMTKPAKNAWNLQFNHLVEFKKLHGHCKVPIMYPENKQLGRWVGSQRKKLKDNCLLPECKARLDELGFVFEAQQGSKRKYNGHILRKYDPVPEKPATELPISGQDLAVRGVDPDEAEWQFFFEQLSDHHKKHKTFIIDKSKPENEALASWVARQQTMKHTGTITKKHYDQLAEINLFKSKPPTHIHWRRVSNLPIHASKANNVLGAEALQGTSNMAASNTTETEHLV